MRDHKEADTGSWRRGLATVCLRTIVNFHEPGGTSSSSRFIMWRGMGDSDKLYLPYGTRYMTASACRFLRWLSSTSVTWPVSHWMWRRQITNKHSQEPSSSEGLIDDGLPWLSKNMTLNLSWLSTDLQLMITPLLRSSWLIGMRKKWAVWRSTTPETVWPHTRSAV